MATATPDRIDAAIASAAEAPLVTLAVQTSSRRVIGMIVPVDLTMQERLDIIGTVARELDRAIAAAAAVQLGPVLEVPGGLHAVPKA